MRPDYNKIARVYDTLVFIVFGSTLDKARNTYLDQINEKNRVLIVGGGTGKIISQLDKLGLSLTVDFVDLSGNMIAIAKKRNQQNLTVAYHEVDILDYRDSSYDIVLCNFFLDQFSAQDVSLILNHLYTKLNPNGLFLYSDFQPSKNMLNQVLMSAMYLFFRKTVKLKKIILSKHKIQFSEVGFRLNSTKRLRYNIYASVFIK